MRRQWYGIGPHHGGPLSALYAAAAARPSVSAAPRRDAHACDARRVRVRLVRVCGWARACARVCVCVCMRVRARSACAGTRPGACMGACAPAFSPGCWQIFLTKINPRFQNFCPGVVEIPGAS